MRSQTEVGLLLCHVGTGSEADLGLKFQNRIGSGLKEIRVRTPLKMKHHARDGTGQHFCSPAHPDLTRNRLAQPVYGKLQLIFRPVV